MNAKEYEKFKQRIDSLVGAIDSLAEDIEEAGGFLTESMEEEYKDNIESAVIHLQEVIENLEADEAMSRLKDKKQGKREEEEE